MTTPRLVPSTRYLLRLAAAAQWRGLVTGIRWGLPPSMQIAIDDAIRRKDWGAKIKVRVGTPPARNRPASPRPALRRVGDRSTGRYPSADKVPREGLPDRRCVQLRYRATCSFASVNPLTV
jgi:hypothetical protein